MLLYHLCIQNKILTTKNSFLVCFSFTYEVYYDFIISFYGQKRPLTATKASVCRCSFKIGVLKTFAIFTGKDLCWSLFLTKLQP